MIQEIKCYLRVNLDDLIFSSLITASVEELLSHHTINVNFTILKCERREMGR